MKGKGAPIRFPERWPVDILAPVLLVSLAFGALSPARLQAQGGAVSGFMRDSGAPVEIIADRLEVRDTERLALFSGNVVVVQGALRMEAERLEVRYAHARPSGAQGERGGIGAGGRIERMKATGAVFITNGVDTAQGEWATFDNRTGALRMGGGVTLTNGENVIQGEWVDVDTNTDRAQVHGGKTRVKALFVPQGESREKTP